MSTNNVTKLESPITVLNPTKWNETEERARSKVLSSGNQDLEAGW